MQMFVSSFNFSNRDPNECSPFRNNWPCAQADVAGGAPAGGMHNISLSKFSGGAVCIGFTGPLRRLRRWLVRALAGPVRGTAGAAAGAERAGARSDASRFLRQFAVGCDLQCAGVGQRRSTGRIEGRRPAPLIDSTGALRSRFSALHPPQLLHSIASPNRFTQATEQLHAF